MDTRQERSGRARLSALGGWAARTVALGALLCAMLCAPAWGQAPSNELPKPKVVELGGDLELDSIVEVTVEGLSEWAAAPGHTPWRLVPYLNGRALMGLYPSAVNLRTSKLQFVMHVTPESRMGWVHVLSPPTLNRNVRFSVGLELQDPFETVYTLEQNPATLVVIEKHWAAVAVAIIAGFTLSFVWLASTTSILFERRPSRNGGEQLRFSLAKTQLAIWFFAIFGAFITIWLATGNYDTINTSIVAILGISAGTAIGDAYIKNSQDAQQEVPEEGTASDAIDAAPAAPPASDASVPRHPRRPHLRRFFRDLLSDSEG